MSRLISTGSSSYGYDAAGNPTSLGNGATQDFNSAEQLTSSSPAGGSATPTISSVSSSTTATSATVTWSTGTASSSFVELGDTSGDYTLDDGTAASVTSHSVTISGLVCGSTYYYQVLSAVGGSGSTSSPATFSTSTCSSGSGITLVGTTDSSGNSGSAAGVSVALPSGIEANDQIILTVTTAGGSAPTAPTGYTLVSSSTSGYSWDPRVTVYRKTATSSESSPWIATGYTQAAASAAVYRGVSTTSPIDGVSDTNANYETSITSNPITTSVPGEKLVLAEGTTAGGSSPPAWTAPTGWTQEADNLAWNSRAAGLADSPIQPLAGGTSTPTATNAEADDSAIVLLGLEPAATPTTTYAYDSIGDRTSATVGSGSPSTYTYDQTGELVTATEAGDSTYTYAYNGDGLRMSKTVDATTESFTWDALSTSLLADGSTYFVYGPDGSPLEQINGTTVYYYLHDQLGATRALTNSSGAVVATFTYDSYGNLLGSTGSVTTPLGFGGGYTDSETGFLYLVNRYYDPSTAQFLSVDPLVDLTGAPYAYTDGDPVNGSDPSGLDGFGIEGGDDPGVGGTELDPDSYTQPETEEETQAEIGNVSNKAAEVRENALANNEGPTSSVEEAEEARGFDPDLDCPLAYEQFEGPEEGQTFTYSSHAADQAFKRGISRSEVETAVFRTEGFEYVEEGDDQLGYYDLVSGVFVGSTPEGRITTLIRPPDGYEYVDRLKQH